MSSDKIKRHEREVERARKWIVRCSLGCAGLVLLIFLILLAIMSWFLASSPLPEPEAFVDEHTTGFALLRPNMADETVEAIVKSLLDEKSKLVLPELSPLRPWITERALSKDPDSTEDRPLQVIYIVSRRPREDGVESNSYLIVISLNRLKGLFRLLRRNFDRANVPQAAADVTRQRHGKVPILTFRDSQSKEIRVVAALETSVLISNDPMEIRRAIDVFTSAPTEFNGPPELNQLYRERPGSSEGFLVLLNEHSEVAELIGRTVGDEAVSAKDAADWDSVLSLECSAHVTPEGNLGIRGTARLRTDASADAVEKFLRELLKSLESEGRLAGSSVELEENALSAEVTLPSRPQP